MIKTTYPMRTMARVFNSRELDTGSQDGSEIDLAETASCMQAAKAWQIDS